MMKSRARALFLLFAMTVGAQAPNFVDDEAPGAQPDGVLQFFKMQHVPIVSSVKVYRNGLRQARGSDFAVYPGGPFPRVGFFPCCIPQAGDVLRFDYRF